MLDAAELDGIQKHSFPVMPVGKAVLIYFPPQRWITQWMFFSPTCTGRVLCENLHSIFHVN